MIEKIAIKNPGCQFCRFFLPSFDYRGAPTPEACLKRARRIFEEHSGSKGSRRWKWSNCAYSSERNKTRHCPDFKIQSMLLSGIRKLYLMLRQADEQHPPSFAKEQWWKT